MKVSFIYKNNTRLFISIYLNIFNFKINDSNFYIQSDIY